MPHTPEEFAGELLCETLKGKGVVKSPDFEVTTPALIMPTNPNSCGVERVHIVSVGAAKEHFSVFGDIPPEAIKYLHVSMRSRWAQLGLEISGFSDENGKYLLTSQIWKGIQQGLTYELPVGIANFGKNPIYIPRGARLFRLYTLLGAWHQNGEKLANLVRSGAISIEGKEGEDWKWFHFGGTTDRNVIGVNLRLKPQRWWIPPRLEGPSVTVSDAGRNFRDEIDSLMEPVPTTDETVFWVGETTAKITLPQNIYAKLNVAQIEINDHGSPKFALQVLSTLIDGGTDWPLRVEVLSPTIDPINFVSLSFYRDEAI
ncbi:hypothetical protein A3A64_00850 [Candidatus Gottesmanbacteria bacterium RIFCSPLOWO2_01_FULL_48_11]|uniref:Uncharacterized protein n=2 Tax=Candidatus Gottesmaniibacteriota TaxID=1752720 RepID=A0A0G1XKY0_9BACT|nr:MAG: hypothetical protein UY27_C0028G0007 [Candidatus Gottesmanbacteria bacterium GW2011_GWA1_48_13]OGG28493.1 MAG: hypothetical protein A3A64_00850 [Candidatus Gottesmanbacteria bacterium RIFCSPLOWO2_01_FULL_48_11]